MKKQICFFLRLQFNQGSCTTHFTQILAHADVTTVYAFYLSELLLIYTVGPSASPGISTIMDNSFWFSAQEYRSVLQIWENLEPNS